MKKIYLLHISHKTDCLDETTNIVFPYSNFEAAKEAYDLTLNTLFSNDGLLCGVDRNNPQGECEIEEDDTLLKFHCHDNVGFDEYDIWVEELDVLENNATFNEDVAYLLKA